MKKYTFLLCGAAFAVLASANTSANAHGVPLVHSPYVHQQGEAKVEFKGAYNVDAHDSEDAWGGELMAGYGVTSFWETEVGIGFEGHEDEDTDVNALIWENKFQFAPKGEWVVDPGLKLEYAHNLESGPDELAAKLLLGKDIGNFSNIANFGIAREIGEDSGDDFEYGFAYALSYQHSDTFAYGLEWHSDFGTLEKDSDGWDEQSHQVGPVISGTIGGAAAHDHGHDHGHSHGGLGYQAGVLFGVSDEAPDATIKAVVEYVF